MDTSLPTDAPGTLDAHTDSVRRFSRFYTRQLGLLDEGLLATGFTLTEARLLYELAQDAKLTASQLVRELALDAGYLSRLLKKFEQQGWLLRAPDPSDARQSRLQLSASGQAAFAPLDRGSREQVQQWLKALSPLQRQDLQHAMQTVQTLLAAHPASADSLHLRGLRPGDLGWVVHRQALLYSHEYGWDASFEALVADIVAKYQQNFDARGENAWIAEWQGRPVGSVFVVRESATVAKLRLLYVEAEARGLGLGRQLVQRCIDFARERGYQTLTLWTNDVLSHARQIYQSTGFELVASEPHHSFGHDLIGEHWTLTL